MEKEVRILNQKQLQVYKAWIIAKEREYHLSLKKADNYREYETWLSANPAPLPPPVKVLTEEEIEKKPFKDFHSTVDKETFCAGYNACLSDLGLK